MKKLLLLLASGSVAFSGVAQHRNVIIANSPLDASVEYATVKKLVNETMHPKSNFASKTTAAPRWYSYGNYLDQYETSLGSSIDGTFPYLWGNNLAKMAYGDGSGGTVFQTNGLVSVGQIVDPAFSGFNEFDFYGGDMKITSTNSYAVDSIRFFGIYGTNPAKLSHVDTLRVSFVHGTGGGSSDIFESNTTIPATGSLLNFGLAGSILKNQRMNLNGSRLTASGSTLVTYDILLDNSTLSWAADTVNGIYVGKVGLGAPGVGISIPANSMIGATVSFISGDPDYYLNTSDTVFRGSPYVPAFKYNMFRQSVLHRGTSAAMAWPTYSATNRNTGSFVDSSNAGIYVPLWFWSANGGSSPASYQNPEIIFHVICTACGVVEDEVSVGSVKNITTQKAYPNPADNELVIPFTLSNEANVTVTLSNMIGQVMATQNLGTVTKGKAVFNTSNLAQGLYSYTVMANGERTTGRVVISH